VPSGQAGFAVPSLLVMTELTIHTYTVGEEVPVYATSMVAKTIEETAIAKREQWQPVYAQEWPDRFRVPDRTVDDGGTVDVAGLRIGVHGVGPAESHADSYLLVETVGTRAAFIGDLAFDGVHSYTADGHSGAWLSALDQLDGELGGTRLYPGHGAQGDTSLLTRQRQYLLMYREAVGRLAAGEPTLTEPQKHELTQVMTAFLPGAPLGWLTSLGAVAVAAELATQPTQPIQPPSPPSPPSPSSPSSPSSHPAIQPPSPHAVIALRATALNRRRRGGPQR
jgi:hypothetical protein